MLVGELLANYEGKIDFIDSTTEKTVCNTYGGSPIISLLQDYEVIEWTAVKSTNNPKVAVLCKFTEPTDEPVEPSDEIEPVETTEGE